MMVVFFVCGRPFVDFVGGSIFWEGTTQTYCLFEYHLFRQGGGLLITPLSDLLITNNLNPYLMGFEFLLSGVLNFCL